MTQKIGPRDRQSNAYIHEYEYNIHIHEANIEIFYIHIRGY